MKTYPVRRAPWTCEWGRSGVAIEECSDGQSRVDDVFWACHYPKDTTGIRLTSRGECERCPTWREAARLRPKSSIV